MSLFLTGRPKTGERYKYIRGGRHKRCIGSGPCKGLSGRYWTEVTIRCGAKMRLPNDECKPTGNQSISHRCHGNDEFNLSYFPPIGPHRGFSTPSHHPTIPHKRYPSTGTYTSTRQLLISQRGFLLHTYEEQASL